MAKQRKIEGKKTPIFVELDEEADNALRWKAYATKQSIVAIISDLLIPIVDEWREIEALRKPLDPIPQK